MPPRELFSSCHPACGHVTFRSRSSDLFEGQRHTGRQDAACPVLLQPGPLELSQASRLPAHRTSCRHAGFSLQLCSGSPRPPVPAGPAPWNRSAGGPEGRLQSPRARARRQAAPGPEGKGPGDPCGGWGSLFQGTDQSKPCLQHRQP